MLWHEGVKFFLIAEPQTHSMASLLKSIYVLYSDYVLKNPFYVTEMPIHCELFDKHLGSLISDSARPTSTRGSER